MENRNNSNANSNNERSSRNRSSASGCPICGGTADCWVHGILRDDELKSINDMLTKLLDESGCTAQISKLVQDYFNERGFDFGLDAFFSEILPLAKASVPQSVFQKMQQHLDNIMASRNNV